MNGYLLLLIMNVLNFKEEKNQTNKLENEGRRRGWGNGCLKIDNFFFVIT